VLIVLAVITATGAMPGITKFVEQIVFAINPAWVKSAVGIFGFAGFVLGHYGKKKSTKHAWVECKDRRTNVKRTHVQKLESSVRDVTNLGKTA